MLLLDAEVRDRDRAQYAPGLAFAVSAATLPAIPAEATPDSSSAVLRASAGADHPRSLTWKLMRSRTSSSLPAAINCRSSRYCWRASRLTRFVSAE